MNRKRCIAICSAAMLVLLCHFGFAEQSDPKSKLSVNQLIEAMKVTESKVKTLSVTVTSANTTIRKTERGTSKAEANYVESWHVTVDGTGWAKGHGNVSQRNWDGSTVTSKETFSCVFDGKVGKRLQQTTISGQQENVRGVFQNKLQGRTISPLRIIQRLSSSIEAGDYRIAKPQTWDGREVIVLEKEFRHEEEEVEDRKVEIWIDPALDYTVVRRRQFKQEKSNEDWVIESTQDLHEFQQVAERIWLPKTTTTVAYLPQGRTENKYVFQDWIVNEEIDHANLQLEFPPGTRVIDFR